MKAPALTLALVLASGCSLSVTFDRDRLADGGMDGSAPGACNTTTHTGCAADELCCDSGGEPTCVSVGASQCTSCGVACNADSSSSCVDRVCVCGDSAACSAGTPFCDDTAGTCVACRDSSDCTEGPCMAGRCVECDPADHSGCEGTAPICNATSFACEACSETPDDCPGILTCRPTGECGGCDGTTHEGCDTPTTPICDDTCRACASDAECDGLSSGSVCVSSGAMTGACGACDPADRRGCSGTTPVCGADRTCGACTSDADCASGTVCVSAGAMSGACGACDPTDSAECSGATPICGAATATCRACGSDTECSDASLGAACDAGGGCGACDSSDSAECTSPTPACNPTTLTCVECVMGGIETECTAIDDGFGCNASNLCECINPMGNRCECGAANCAMGQRCIAATCT